MTVVVGSTPAWKHIMPKTALNTRGHAFTVSAFGYDQCEPMTWGTARLRPVQLVRVNNWASVVPWSGNLCILGQDTEHTIASLHLGV